MTMLETKKEIELAMSNNSPLPFDALASAWLAVKTYITLYGSHDIRLEINLGEEV